MKKNILDDHKKVGKKFIPSLATLNNLVELGWVDLIVPDLIWIALIRKKLGDKIGTQIVNKFISISTKYEGSEFKMFAFIKSFEALSDETKTLILNDLIKEGMLQVLLNCLGDFLKLYPLCPLGFLQTKTINNQVDSKFMIGYKEILNELLDKRSKLATFTLANVIYSLFEMNRIEIEPNSIIAKLPRVQEYPNTELSKMIASNLRAMVNSFYGKGLFDDQSSVWAKSFWNVGIKLEPCKI